MIDDHIPSTSLSRALGSLVGHCAKCGGECCNCKVCVSFKDDRFNVCAECARKLQSAENAGQPGERKVE